MADPWWNQACSELRADIPFRTKNEEVVLDRLEDLEYPPLAVMLRSFTDELRGYLMWDALGLLKLVGGSMSQSPIIYVTNSLEAVSLSEEALQFSGVAFEMRKSEKGAQ